MINDDTGDNDRYRPISPVVPAIANSNPKP